MSKEGTQNPSFELEETVDSIPKTFESQNHEISVDTTTRSTINPGALVVQVRENLQVWSRSHQVILKRGILTLILLGAHIYLGIAINYKIQNDIPMDWCNGLGALLVLVGLLYWSFLYYVVLKRVFGPPIRSGIFRPISRIWAKGFVRACIYTISGIGLIVFIILDTRAQPRRLVSGLGIPIFIVIGFILSRSPSYVRWSQIVWGIGLQFTFGILILRWEPGRQVLDCISSKVARFLEFTTVGSDFVYSYLSSGTKISNDVELSPIFVFRSLSVMYFFGFMISLLYHYGAMQWVVVKLGWLLQATIGTTSAESMSTSANIFIGMSEAPLLIKPFLSEMTLSEIHAVMTGGFATIAGTVMAAYISFGISPLYLISACIMAAPASLGFSKLLFPETEVSRTRSKDISLLMTKSKGNAINAASEGAIQGVLLIGAIVANIIAFVAFVAFLNSIIWWLGTLVGISDLSFEYLLGQAFIPVAYLIGIDSEEIEEIAILLGLKTVANEFIAYKRLATMDLSPRSRAVATYALCSFTNMGSIGIQIGSLGSLIPERRGDIGNTIGRAFVAATLVGFVNACMAGLLLSEPGYEEWIAGKNSTFEMTTQGCLSCR